MCTVLYFTSARRSCSFDYHIRLAMVFFLWYTMCTVEIPEESLVILIESDLHILAAISVICKDLIYIYI